MTFSLTSNHFHVLGISPRSRREEIGDAYETTLSESLLPENELLHAQQDLLNPRRRVLAETSALVGVAPTKARAIIKQLQTAKRLNSATVLEQVDGLARANLAAHLCDNGQGRADTVIAALLEAYEDFDAQSVTEMINSERSISGFAPVRFEHAEEALDKLREAHSRSLLTALEKSRQPHKLLLEIVEGNLANGDQSRLLLEDLVRLFDRSMESERRTVKEAIERDIETLREHPGRRSVVAKLARKLGKWNEYCAPAQVVAESKALDEEQSLALFESVRDLYLLLANEAGENETALEVCRVLSTVFQRLPGARHLLEQDLETLAMEFATAALIEVAAEVHDAPDAFDSEVEQHGVSVDSGGLVGKLVSTFMSVLGDVESAEHADAPWMVVRGVAIELHNERQLTRSALALTDYLLEVPDYAPSAEFRDQLLEDRRIFVVDLKSREVTAAVEREDLQAALALARELVPLTEEGEERKAAQELVAKLEGAGGSLLGNIVGTIVRWLVTFGILALLWALFD